MQLTLKPISEQVIVITGASSGIGLVTARSAARRGALVVLAARNERDLARATEAIVNDGGRATYQVADVSELGDVRRIAETAIGYFGRIDTWVNNAAVAVYGRITEVPLRDMRRQFDVNYWGQVHGCLTAIPHLSQQGGSLINVASALADRAIPLQGNYCAAKHALKAFTDSLRMELEADGIPIAVTLVKPGSIDTPLFEKARSYMGVEPQPVPPVFAPEAVADVILECAEHPRRDVIVGGMGKVISLANAVPRLADKYMERTTFDSQRTTLPIADTRRDNLYAPLPDDGGARGRNWSGRTAERSVYTAAVMNPKKAVAVAAAAGLTLISGLRRLTRSRASRNGSLPPPSRPR
jgi:NAD(P)-dependent dehydrogenase (short-subunit alcohol dehydrogenase family)